MVQNDALLNALRSLGYKFKRQTDRMMIYKKPGNTARVFVRRNAAHDEEYVRILLTQAGMSSEKINNFMKQVCN